MLIKYRNAGRNNARYMQYEIIANSLRETNKQLEQKIQLLKRYIVKIKEDKEQLALKVREKEEELEALNSLFIRARSCIKEALQVIFVTDYL